GWPHARRGEPPEVDAVHSTGRTSPRPPPFLRLTLLRLNLNLLYRTERACQEGSVKNAAAAAPCWAGARMGGSRRRRFACLRGKRGGSEPVPGGWLWRRGGNAAGGAARVGS